MSHSTTSPLRALYRVFILPALSTPPTQPRPRPRSSPIPAIHHHLHQTSQFSHSPILAAKTRPAERRHQKWDSEISAKIIHLVDPLTNTLSEEPRTRYDILKTLDTRTHRLVQLTPDEPGNPNFIPACKIISKKDAYELEKKKKLQLKESKRANSRASSAGMKTLELNWAIDKGDLGHRLGKLRGFLEEGRRVEVCFRGKRRGRKASLEECEGVLGAVRGVGEGIGGVRVSDLEGKVGGVAALEFVVKEGGRGGGGGKGEGLSGRGREAEEEDDDDDGGGDDDGDGDGDVERVENR